VTDANGNQKLAFTSSQSSFDVQATDRVSNALEGNYGGDGTTAATGRELGTTVTGAGTVAAQAARDFSAAAAQQTLTFNGGGLSGPVQITLDGDYTAAAGTMATAVNAKLAAVGLSGVTMSISGGNQLVFTRTQGAISVSAANNPAAGDATGLVATAAADGTTSTGSIYSDTVASGTYEMGAAGGATNFTWANVTAGSQAITIAANDSSGAPHGKTVTLASGTTGASIGAAVAALNDALQKSNDATLQQITAVEVNDSGVQKINFVSTLPQFSVSVGTATGGMKDGAGLQGTTNQAVQVGAASSGDITTATGAKAAVTALTSAVRALGTAQAAVGKGQNQIAYALGLAESQITNFSAAQAQIRDADVAAEAANLTKAQVLHQASIAAMAQANSAPQAVLSLLRG
jgi:flagellin